MSNSNELTIMVQPRDRGWITLGTNHRFEVVPESIEFDGDPNEYGCLNATWKMKVNPRWDHYDLEHYTPVVIMDGAEEIWSGRIIGTPTTYGDEGEVSVEAQGWGQHTKDDCIDKIWLHSDLTQWKDIKSGPEADIATNWKASPVSVSTGGQPIFEIPDNASFDVAVTYNAGIYLDLGPNNIVDAVSVTWKSSGNAAGADLKLTTATGLDNAASFGTVHTVTNLGVASGGPTTYNFATGYRYVLLYFQDAGIVTYTANAYCKILSAIVATNRNDLASSVSDLHASDIISETLDAACPLISSDRTKLTATTFDIPEFYT